MHMSLNLLEASKLDHLEGEKAYRYEVDLHVSSSFDRSLFVDASNSSVALRMTAKNCAYNRPDKDFIRFWR